MSSVDLDTWHRGYIGVVLITVGEVGASGSGALRGAWCVLCLYLRFLLKLPVWELGGGTLKWGGMAKLWTVACLCPSHFRFYGK